MSQFKSTNSTQANNWAQQRKEAMEKAKKLRDDRKYNFKQTGEMAMQSNLTPSSQNLSATTGRPQQKTPNSENYYGGHANTYNFSKQTSMPVSYGAASFNDIPVTDEEHFAAASSLRLLKSKMKNNSERFGSYNNVDAIDTLAERDPNVYERGNPRSGGSQFGGYEPVKSRGNDYQNVNENQGHPQNQNYRKLFKPNVNQGQNNYQREDEGFGGSYGNRQQQNVRQDNYGDDNRFDGYGGKPQDTYGKPSGGYSKQSNYDDYEPQNVPSRVQKTNIAKKPQFKQPEWNSDTTVESQPEPPKQNKGKFNYSEEETQEDGYQPAQRQPAKQAAAKPLPKQSSYNPNKYANAEENTSSHTYGRGANQYGGQAYTKESLDLPKSRESSDYQNYSKGGNQGYQAQNEDPYSKNNFQQQRQAPQQRNQAPTYGQNLKKQQVPPKRMIGNPFEQPGEDNRSIKQADPRIFEKANERPDTSQRMVRCPAGCGRSFFEDAIEKHANVCRKVFQTKRKKFDMAAQRLTEDQAKVMETQPVYPTRGKPIQAKSKPVGKSSKASWKQQSEAFRANLKAARGGALTQQEQAAVSANDNRVSCDYCFRQFSEEAAKRHVPFCQSKSKNEAMKRGPSKPMPKRKW